MRILAITNLFPNAREPNRGCFNLQQFEALSRGHDVRVIAPIPWRPWAHGLQRTVPFEEQWKGIKTLHPHYFYTPGIGRAAYSLWMYASLRQTVRREVVQYRPDVLLGTWAYPDAVAVGLLARRLGLPWVAKVHGSDVNVSAALPLLHRQIRWALCRASATFSVSKALKERLVAIGVPSETIRVQHNGVNIERFELREKSAAREALGLPREPQIVLYVGNLKVSKGVVDLVEAARLMAADTPGDALFVIVGGGAAHGKLVEEIRRGGLEDRVRLAGARPHAEIPVWMAAADVFCLPSHQEGCPNVVLEALACGRPVVATSVGAVPEMIDDSVGALVAAGDPPQLAGALRAVLAREWQPPRMRERVLPMSWEENARVLAAELERACRAHQQPAAPGAEAPALS